MVSVADYGSRGRWFETGRVAIHCGLEQVTFTPCLVLVKPRKRWTDDRLGQTVRRLRDYVVPNVLSPRDLVSRPDNMDETVLHTYLHGYNKKLIRFSDLYLIFKVSTGLRVQSQNQNVVVLDLFGSRRASVLSLWKKIKILKKMFNFNGSSIAHP